MEAKAISSYVIPVSTPLSAQYAHGIGLLRIPVYQDFFV